MIADYIYMAIGGAALGFVGGHKLATREIERTAKSTVAKTFLMVIELVELCGRTPANEVAKSLRDTYRKANATEYEFRNPPP